MVELRDYQVSAVERLRESIRAGHRRIVCVAATGAGKTVIAAHIVGRARARGGSILFVAHRKELVDQTSAKLDAIDVDHGVIMAKHPRARPWCAVQVASIQTLVRRQFPAASLIVVDECHHARAASYQKIFDAYPSVPVIGLTATPWRSDGMGLKEQLFEDSILVSTPADLCRAGWLVPVTGFSYEAMDVSGVRMRGSDYDIEALAAAAYSQRKILGDIVRRWCESARELSTVLFAVDVKHSMELCARFRAEGIKAEHLDGETPKKEREAILARLRSRETRLVSNCMVLTEGWDEPSLECIILARPTASEGLYLQMVGRGRRPSPNKRILRIHDHTGAVLRHGEPDAPRDWSLRADAKRKKSFDSSAGDGNRLCVCEECRALFDAKLTHCQECGHEREVDREPPQVDLAATPVAIGIARALAQGQRRLEPEVLKRSFYRRAREYCRRTSYKPGLAYFRYLNWYGEKPPWTWKLEEDRIDEAARGIPTDGANQDTDAH